MYALNRVRGTSFILPDYRWQHICFGSYGKLQDCPPRHIFSCVCAFSCRRRQSETDTGNRRRQQTEKDVDVTEMDVDKTETDTGNRYRQPSHTERMEQAGSSFIAMFSSRRHKTDDVHAHTRPRARALCEEVLHPSSTSFSQLLPDAFKVHFSHEAF